MAASRCRMRETQSLNIFRFFYTKFKPSLSYTHISRSCNVSRTYCSSSGTSISQESDENEIFEKRNKSGMAKHTRQLMLAHSAMPEIRFDYQLKDAYQRRLYAKFGRNSNVNPGIMWPTKEKLHAMIEHEREFEPDLRELKAEVEKDIREEKEAVLKRENEVEKNFLSLNKWMTDLQARKQKKLNEIKAQQEKKERAIEEVRQYFGYRLNPKDPKFVEVLEKKEKEEKKAMKEEKKKERFAREMARLSSMVQAGLSTTTVDTDQKGVTASSSENERGKGDVQS